MPGGIPHRPGSPWRGPALLVGSEDVGGSVVDEVARVGTPVGAGPRTVMTPLRLPPDLVERADRLVPLVAADPKVAAVGRVTRSAVLRTALVKGLESMEWQYAPKKAKGRGRR